MVWQHKESASTTDHYHWNATTTSETRHSRKTTYSTSILTEVCQNPPNEYIAAADTDTAVNQNFGVRRLYESQVSSLHLA